MYRGVRNVAEEGFLLVPFDEVDGGIGDGVCNYCLAGRIGYMSNGLVSYNPGQGRVVSFGVTRNPHVIGIGNALIFIEALGQRHKWKLVAEMPFTEAAGLVPSFFENLGYGSFFWIQTPLICGENHTSTHLNTVGVAPSQKSGSGGGAGGGTDVKVGEFHSFLRHPVQVRGGVIGTKGSNVPIPHVIGENDYDIGLVHIRGYPDAANPINQEKGKGFGEGTT